jgi:hypothetical protein
MTADPRVRTADPRVRTADPRVRTADPRVRTADPRVRTADPRVVEGCDARILAVRASRSAAGSLRIHDR